MKVRAFVAAVAVSVGLSSFPAAMTAATTADVSETAVAGSAARIAACREAAQIRGEVKVDLLFVVDVSSSLRNSDPFGKTIRDPARVRAIESVLLMLRSTQSTSVQVRLNFLDFGSSVRPSFGSSAWQSIDEFDSGLIKDFGGKNDDDDTDYVGALVDEGGVVDVLSRVVRESDCQVVLWFTDGRFEFEDKRKSPGNFAWLEAELGVGKGVVRDRASAAKAQEVGEKLLCGVGASRQRAIADDVRALDTGGALTVIGVGLNTSGAVGNFALLQRLLEGLDCGTLDPVGFMVEVTSADDLAVAMRDAIFGGDPPPLVCDIEKIDPGASFYIAEPVRRADLFMRSRERVSEIQLVRLGGDNNLAITLFKNGTARPAETLEGIKVSTRLLDDSPTLETTLEFTAPTEKWVGDWVLRACNESGLPAQIDADLVVRGCVAFELAAGYDEIVVGRSTNLFLVLKRCGDDASRLSTVSALSLGAEMIIDGKKVKATLSENESLLEVPFTPTEASLGGSTSRKIKLQVTEVNATYEVLKGARPVVLEWSRDNSVFDITLKLPPKTPYVELLGCNDMAERATSAVCEFKAVAKDAVGQVSTEGARVLPVASLGAGVTFFTSSSAKFPLTVRPGSPELFSITFDLTGVRKNERVATQSFDVEFSYETEGEPIETGAFTGEFAIEPNLSISIDRLRALIYALAALAIAIGMFSAARWLTASIQMPEGAMLWIATLNLPRTDAETARAALLGSKISASSVPLQSSPLGVREVEPLGPLFESGSRLRARAGWRLLSELGYVEVSSASRRIFAAGGHLSRSGNGRVSLNLVKEWWIVSDWQDEENSGESPDALASRIASATSRLVVVTTGADAPRSLLEDIARRIDASLPDQVSSLAESMWREPDPAQAPSDTPSTGLPEI